MNRNLNEAILSTEKVKAILYSVENSYTRH